MNKFILSLAYLISGLFLSMLVFGCSSPVSISSTTTAQKPTDQQTALAVPKPEITVTPQGFTPIGEVSPSPFLTFTPSVNAPFSSLLTPTVTGFLTSTPSPISLPIPLEWLAFSIWGSERGIGIIDTQGNQLTPLFGEKLSGYGQYPAWSPDGHWLAFLYEENLHYGSPGLYIIHRTGSSWQQIAVNVQASGISWSLDGKKLAYAMDDIYIIGVNEESYQRIDTPEFIEYYPTWSPNGTEMAYLRNKANEPGVELCLMDANGKNQRRILDTRIGFGKISWSPDGKLIAYRSLDGCGDLCTVNVENGESYCLTNTLRGEMDPVWSPDGKRIAFLGTYDDKYCDASGNEGTVIGWQIYLMDSGGGNIFQLTNDQFTYRDLAWSPVPALRIGDTYQIKYLGDNLNLRVDHSLEDAIIEKMKEGESVVILDGPVDQDNYYWWRMRTTDGVVGWAVEVAGWFELVPSTTPTPAIPLSTVPAPTPTPLP